MLPVGLRGWAEAGSQPSGLPAGHPETGAVSLYSPQTKVQMFSADPEVLLIQERPTDDKKNVSLYVKYGYGQGMDRACPQASSPPGGLITKHEDATRQRRGGGFAACEAGEARQIGPSQSGRVRAAAAPPQCNYTQTCWMLSRECGQRVTGELMKCQDGAREIASLTSPQGALVVFLRMSHTGAGRRSRSVETQRKVVPQHSPPPPSTPPPPPPHSLLLLSVFGVSVEKIASAASKGHGGHEEI